MTKLMNRLAWVVLTVVITVGLTACTEPVRQTLPKEEDPPVQSPETRNIIANNVFFYYSDLETAWRFYTDTLGFDTVADYGFAKIMRLAETSYITLVDADAGMKFADAPKTVAMALVTDELHEWYEYLVGQGVAMRGSGPGATQGSAHDGFVVIDPEGYYLEFERFNEHPENELFMPMLDSLESLRPSGAETTNRPTHLGIKATVLWLYSNDVHAMSDFYEQVMGFGLVVDQGGAMIHRSSASGFIGPVDGTKGMHSWTEDKAVMLSLLTTDIDGWFAHLGKEPDFAMRDHQIGVESRAGARVFVGLDPDGYFIELDEFFASEDNERLLESLASTG